VEPLEATAEALTRCPLCDARDWRSLPVPRRWIGGHIFGALRGTLGLVRCEDCGLVFVNPRPSNQTLSLFYSGNDYGFHDVDGSAATGRRADFFLERVLRQLPTGAPRTLLDFGAGGGGFIRHANRCGWQARGFEPAAQGLASCRRAGLDVTDRLDDLPSEEFGLVTLHHVLEHLPNPTEVLRGVRRFVAAQGRMYVEVPNARSLRARLAFPCLSQQFDIDERHRAYPAHLFYYSPHTLRRQLTNAGWTIEDMFTIGIGLDEFIIRRELKESTPQPLVERRTNTADCDRAQSRRRLRTALRDRFLEACLGENIGVIARVTGFDGLSEVTRATCPS
jgi:2-polyprenyl-3-methyl-5-hydroxy-6-metoxy-1,4-benzoquinol methylase